MKKTLLALAALTIVFASCVKNDPPPPPAGESELKGKLFLNEINGWPSDDPAKNFELYNATDAPISLNGFYTEYGIREMWVGRAEDVIPARGYKLIQGANAGYPGFNTGLSNRNPNISITFYDAAGKIIDYYEKADDLRGTPLEYMCHMRIPDGGKWYYIPNTSATPGAANLPSVPSGATEMPSMEKVLKIDEVNVSATSPAPDVVVTVTARVTDVNTITSVLLKWKKGDVDQSDIPMTSAGEKIYTTTIPGQPDGTVVSWTVSASNNKNKTVTTEASTITWKTPLDYTKLVLTEVSGNNKYVEIYNSGSVTIPLEGVKLQRNGGPSGGSEWTGSSTATIPAGAYRIFLFNSYTPAELSTNPAYTGWTVGSGISSGQILKVAIVDPQGTEVSVFIRGDVPLPSWGSTAGVTQNTDDTYSRMSNGTWAYAAPTPGVANGAKTEDIVSPGYLTAQP